MKRRNWKRGEETLLVGGESIKIIRVRTTGSTEKVRLDMYVMDPKKKKFNSCHK